ncbi:MAG: OmpA family protein [Succinivibrio sp.]
MRSVLIKMAFLTGAILFSLQSSAQIRYQAPLDSSAKKLWSNESSRIKCSLIFDIPSYGFANFMTYSGRTLRSALTIHPKLGIGQSSYMRFISTKPEWHSASHEQLLGRIALYEGFAPYVGPTLSWKILSELSHGNQILMPYTDSKLASGQNIIPSLSPLGFDEAYKKYLSCQEQLIRVNFNDIKMMPLVFKLRSDELTAKSQDMLNEQLEYLKYDKSIISIVIRAYAYDMEKNADNINLARDRGERIKKAYLDLGINEDIITVVPFNALTLNTKEENPIVDEAPTSRNALITLERDNALINKDMEVNVPDVGANTGETP